MKVDFDIIFRHNRAHRGDIKSMCEMVNHFSLCDDWVSTIKYFELLVDNKPEICEAKLEESTKLEVPYELMLGLIGQVYYEQRNFETAYRWFQKCLDYLTYKNTTDKAKEERDERYKQIYKIMEDANELDKIHNRFLLKWEQDLFYRK